MSRPHRSPHPPRDRHPTRGGQHVPAAHRYWTHPASRPMPAGSRRAAGEPGPGRGLWRELEHRRLGRLLRLRGFVPLRSSQRSLKPSPSVSRLRGFVWKRRTSAPSRRRSRSVSARRGCVRSRSSRRLLRRSPSGSRLAEGRTSRGGGFRLPAIGQSIVIAIARGACAHRRGEVRKHDHRQNQPSQHRLVLLGSGRVAGAHARSSGSATRSPGIEIDRFRHRVDQRPHTSPVGRVTFRRTTLRTVTPMRRRAL